MPREIDEIKDAAGAYRKWALEARKKYIELRLRQDPEIRDLYIRAADRVAKELRKLAMKTPSNYLRYYLRKRQLEELEVALRAEADRLTGSLTKAFEQYIKHAVEAGGGYSQAIVLDLFKKAGMDITGLRTMFVTVNRQAVEACWARTKKGLFLSDRIWEQGENFRNTMRDMIQEAVATGQDAVKTARMLQQYVRQGKSTLAANYPNMMERMAGWLPGDICYEALRLARTEMTAAFGEGTVSAAQVSPSYQGMKWVLSHSHPVVDMCDTLAEHDEGLGRGVYSPGDEPPYPAHPNCLCALIPIHEEPEEFVARLKRWTENPESEPELEKWYNDIYLEKASEKDKRLVQALRETEAQLIKRKTEKAVVFNDDGSIFFEKEGNEDSVSFSVDELQLFEDKILTHNHPRGSSFSMDDVHLATYWNFKGIRACGSQYRYYLNRPASGWSREMWEKKIKPLAEKIHNDVFRQFSELINKGKLTPEEANYRHWHEVWSRVAKEVGLDYGREEW
jgi:hypothetical protein